MPTTLPAEFVPFTDADADPALLWGVIARAPKDVKKAFRAGEFSIPYVTGVAMLQAAPHVPSAYVWPNLAAVLSFTEADEQDEQLVPLAWDVFVDSLDVEELWFRLSFQAVDAFATRVSLTLGKTPSLVVSKKHYEVLGKALTHVTPTYPYATSIYRLPAARKGPAADTLVWVAATNNISDPEMPSMLGWISAPAWGYVPDDVLETFIRYADFSTLHAIREVGLRLGKPDCPPMVGKAFAHIPEQLRTLVR